MKKVGISASLTIDNSSRFDNYKMVRVADNYIQTIAKIGAMPFVLPMIEDESIIEEQVRSLDALILSGGEDIDPRYYGELPTSKLGEISAERDAYDFKLAKYALKHNIPVLGICRGAQILNVILGGTLHQDHSYINGDTHEHNNKGNQSLPTHKVLIEERSFLHSILGREAMVNSFHHQSVKKAAPSVKVIAVGDDGVVEGFESVEKDRFILGIQWHPEMMANHGDENMIALFREFINYQNPLRASVHTIYVEERA